MNKREGIHKILRGSRFLSVSSYLSSVPISSFCAIPLILSK